MIEKTLEITGNAGLDARSAAMIAHTAGDYTSNVWIVKDDKRVSGKSVMGLMSLTASRGSVIIIGADGEDEKAAVEALISIDALGLKEIGK